MLKCYEENEEIFIRNPNDLLRVRGLQAQLPEVLPRGESSGWTWVVPTKAQDKKEIPAPLTENLMVERD